MTVLLILSSFYACNLLHVVWDRCEHCGMGGELICCDFCNVVRKGCFLHI